MKKSSQIYDYIVVGAGSAGAIVASRLSEDPKSSVLLVEYGGSDSSILRGCCQVLCAAVKCGIPLHCPKLGDTRC